MINALKVKTSKTYSIPTRRHGIAPHPCACVHLYLFPRSNHEVGGGFRNDGVVAEFEVGDTTALGERAELGGEAEEFGERDLGGDDAGLSALAHRFDAPALAVDHTRHIAHELLGDDDFQFHDWFEQYGLRFLHRILHRVDGGEFEGDF